MSTFIQHDTVVQPCQIPYLFCDIKLARVQTLDTSLCFLVVCLCSVTVIILIVVILGKAVFDVRNCLC